MRRLKPFFLLVVFTLIFFRKTFILGLVPIPFDLLTGWFFPYISGGWSAQGILTLYKGGHFASDAIRQIYPWKELVIDLFKSRELPLWNPYAFSGSPLLANMQSSPLDPLNIVFFLTSNFPIAWAAYVISAVFFASLFMFLFLKSLKLASSSALFGSIAFAASGYMIVWLEWGSVVHQLIWLPLSLFSLLRWWESEEKKYLILLTISASFTIFAGYPQGALYNFIIVFTWFVFLLKNTVKKKRKELALPLAAAGILVIGITAVQWLPTAELFFQSAMRGQVSQQLSSESALPLPQFATLFAPDYFGNRVSDNYWAKEFGEVDYMDADLFVGATTGLLAVVALLGRKRFREINWLIVLLLIGVILGARTPIVSLISNLGIPVLNTGAAAKALLISIFSLCGLGAFGLEQILNGKAKKNALRATWIIASLFAFLILATFFLDDSKALIARKSLIVPGAAFASGATFLLFKASKLLRSARIGIAFLVIVALELLLHAGKILPFSSAAFAFPEHILVSELQRRSGYDRVDGFWESEIATNFHTAFRLYSAEGYDPLYIRRYGEFVTAAEEGRLPALVPRSDADITMANETNRDRLVDLTAIKYIFAKVTNPEEAWEEEPLKYNPERFKLVWQSGNFKIYENLHALPRAKLFYAWQVISDDEKIIKTLYDQKFNPHEQVILEKDPAIEMTVLVKQGQSLLDSSSATITDYRPTHVEVQTAGNQPAILLLTDSFYSGWKASVDGKPTEILRANYTFRALPVPPGIHVVAFTYNPSSFLWGLRLSVLSLCLLLVAAIAFKSKKGSRT